MAILFLHIPKAAGTYVDSCVKQAKINSAHGVSSTDDLTKAIEGNKTYIAGHFTYNILASVPVSCHAYKLVTVIRNPIDRFISDVNYHIEILKRGRSFLEKHTAKWQHLILRTYSSVQEVQLGKPGDFSHLSQIMLTEYLASRLLSNNEIMAIRSKEVEHAADEMRTLLTRYSFIGHVERGGADLLLNYICTDLSIDTSKFMPNPNASQNYIAYADISPSVLAGLADSPVSNLAYLILTDQLPDSLPTQDWDSINKAALLAYQRESSYKMKESNQLPVLEWQLA